MDVESFYDRLRHSFNQDYTTMPLGVVSSFYIKHFYGWITFIGNKPEVKVFSENEEHQKAFVRFATVTNQLEIYRWYNDFTNFCLSKVKQLNEHLDVLSQTNGEEKLKKILCHSECENEDLSQKSSFMKLIQSVYDFKLSLIVNAYIAALQFSGNVEPYFTFNICDNCASTIKGLPNNKIDSDITELMKKFDEAYIYSLHY